MSRIYVIEIGPTIVANADGQPMIAEKAQKLSVRGEKIEYKHCSSSGALFFHVLDGKNNILFTTHASNMKYVWTDTPMNDDYTAPIITIAEVSNDV